MEFALPKQKNDLTKGWELVDEEEDSMVEDGLEDKSHNTTLMGAGLKDGAVLAFRFRGAEWDVEVPQYDDDVEMGAD